MNKFRLEPNYTNENLMISNVLVNFKLTIGYEKLKGWHAISIIHFIA